MSRSDDLPTSRIRPNLSAANARVSPASTTPSGPGLFAWYAQGFSDTLGDRLLLFDNTEQSSLELVRLHSRLFDYPAFERAVREQTRGLSTLDDPSFARVWRVERLPEPGGGIALVSTHAPGSRLSEILAGAARQNTTLETVAAFLLIKQLVAAITALHLRSADIGHGAINPERLVVTPEGRVIIHEYVLGPALATLSWQPARFWKELRVPVPLADDPVRLDQRTDCLQIGMVALALLLNRPIRADEYPAALPQLVERASDSFAAATLRPALRAWLEKLLQLDPQPFTSADQASSAFDAILSRLRVPLSTQSALRSFLLSCATQALPPTATPATAAVAVSPSARARGYSPNAEVIPERLGLPAAPTFVALQREVRLLKAAVIVLAIVSLGEAWFIGAQLTSPPRVDLGTTSQHAAPATTEAPSVAPPVSTQEEPVGLETPNRQTISSGTVTPEPTPLSRPSSTGMAPASTVATMGFESPPASELENAAVTAQSGGASSPLPETAPPLPNAVELAVAEQLEIRNVIARYEAAFNASNITALREAWPTADETVLAPGEDEGPRQVALGACSYEFVSPAVTAHCQGTIAVGSLTSGEVSTETRLFTFKLRKVTGVWQIDSETDH